MNNQITSAAFDFPIRYVVRDAIDESQLVDREDRMARLTTQLTEQYAVTFVENHEAEYRSADEQQANSDRKDTLAANAYILAFSAGTPCVFYKHWIDCKQDIKAINATHASWLASPTPATPPSMPTKVMGYNGIMTVGKKASLIAIVGPNANQFAAPEFIRRTSKRLPLPLLHA